MFSMSWYNSCVKLSRVYEENALWDIPWYANRQHCTTRKNYIRKGQREDLGGSFTQNDLITSGQSPIAAQRNELKTRNE